MKKMKKKDTKKKRKKKIWLPRITDSIHTTYYLYLLPGYLRPNRTTLVTRESHGVSQSTDPVTPLGCKFRMWLVLQTAGTVSNLMRRRRYLSTNAQAVSCLSDLRGYPDLTTPWIPLGRLPIPVKGMPQGSPDRNPAVLRTRNLIRHATLRDATMPGISTTSRPRPRLQASLPQSIETGWSMVSLFSLLFLLDCHRIDALL
ncbi:hypothetical protein GGR52DRAFT_519577 [Hypoxylon sp. FL1284]|nr:hypothetical protein GGR52DRAFT_519577 [Hypoxylon sp. FL1284]